MILLRYWRQKGQLISHPLGMVSFSQGAASRALLHEGRPRDCPRTLTPEALR